MHIWFLLNSLHSSWFKLQTATILQYNSVQGSLRSNKLWLHADIRWWPWISSLLLIHYLPQVTVYDDLTGQASPETMAPFEPYNHISLQPSPYNPWKSSWISSMALPATTAHHVRPITWINTHISAGGECLSFVPTLPLHHHRAAFHARG